MTRSSASPRGLALGGPARRLAAGTPRSKRVSTCGRRARPALRRRPGRQAGDVVRRDAGPGRRAGLPGAVVAELLQTDAHPHDGTVEFIYRWRRAGPRSRNAGGAHGPEPARVRGGTALACAKGTWTGAGPDYRYSWNRTVRRSRTRGRTRTSWLNEDLGTSLSCTVTARNTAGTRSATTAGLSIDGIVAGAPTPSTAPGGHRHGGPRPDAHLRPGAWAGTPTGFTVLWRRDGETVGNGPTWVGVGADTTARCAAWSSRRTPRARARRARPGSAQARAGATGVVINGGDADATSPDAGSPSGCRPRRRRSVALHLGPVRHVGCADRDPVAHVHLRLDDGLGPRPPLTWSVHVQLHGTGAVHSDAIRIDRPALRFGVR